MSDQDLQLDKLSTIVHKSRETKVVDRVNETGSSFATRVDNEPIALVDPVSLSNCIKGIKRRIAREQTQIKFGKRDNADELYILKRKQNVSRLQIIKKQISELYNSLI